MRSVEKEKLCLHCHAHHFGVGRKAFHHTVRILYW